MKKDLTTILAELSANQSDEDRERSRAQLQQQYQECDSRLSQLVRTHRESVSQSVQVCSKVINAVAESKNRCQNLKDRITNCMNMLQYNRENIRKMWLESLQHKYAHKILSEIEELRKIPREVNESLINKKLEHATEVIVSSVKLFENIQCNADALKELKSELQHLQEKLFFIVLEDLRSHLHLANFIDNYFADYSGDITYDDVFTNKIPKSEYYFKDKLDKISFDKVYINVLLNCLSTMKRLPDAVEFLKVNCQPDLEAISHQVSKFMHDIIKNSVDIPVLDLPMEKQRVFLIDLIENITFIFIKVSNNYKCFLSILKPIIEIKGVSDVEFLLDDIYSKIQASVEYFVGYYLGSQSTYSPALPSQDYFIFSNSQNIGDIGDFFNPQDTLESKNSTLFKFSSSSHGISYKKFSREAKLVSGVECPDDIEKSKKMELICRPSLNNVTLVFNLLKHFVSEIEQSMDLDNADHSPLYAFLYDSAILFLDQVNTDINKRLKNASANLEAWNTTIVSDFSSPRVYSEKQVLSCSLNLENVMNELLNLVTCIPDYTNHFLRLIFYIILEYKEMHHKAFKQMFEEEHIVLSISWARDRDIRRLMKSFLNWRHLEDPDYVDDNVESTEEVRMRNKEESELLIRNLRTEDKSSWEIIADMNKLSNLALLQENLITFSVMISKLISIFGESQSNVQVASDSTSKTSVENIIPNDVPTGFRKFKKEYQDFADMCLVALHLEARARCFHYLLTFTVQEIYVENIFIQEFDTAVSCLIRDFKQIEEVLHPILTVKEFKYVFEGLGELIASLVILIISNMSRINETVVLKIDRNISLIHGCLTEIKNAREVSLERARQFIDLFQFTHLEILDQIVEEGPRFSEKEYATVFRLLSSSTVEATHGFDYYVEKLRMIFERLSANVKAITAVL